MPLWIKKASVVMFAVFGLFLIAVWLLFFTSLLAKPLGQLTANIASAKLGRTVQIKKGITLGLSSGINVQAKGISLSGQSPDDKVLADIGELRFDVSVRDLLRGHINLSNLAATESRVILQVDQDGNSSWSNPDPVEGTAVDEVKPSTGDPSPAASPKPGAMFAKEIHLTNTSLLYQDARNGLDLNLDMASLELSKATAKSPFLLQGVGAMNGQNLTLNGAFPDDEPFKLNASFDKMKLQIAGEPHKKGYAAGYSGTVALNIDELGQFLDVLKLQKPVSGTGNINASFASDATGPRVDNLDIKVMLDGGQNLDLTGNLGQLANASDDDIHARILLYSPEKMPPRTRSRLNLKLTGIDMRLRPDSTGTLQRAMVIATNGFSVVSGGHGPPPISVSQIKRTPDGLLKLGKTFLRIGPAEKPYLVLKGSVTDAFRLQGMDFLGNLELPAASLVAPEYFGDSDILGILTGDFQLNGDINKLGLSDFNATTKGTDLWTLTATGSASNLLDLSDVGLDLSVNVPSGQKLLSKLGLKPVPTGKLTFDVSVSSKGDEWKSDASISVAESHLTMKAELGFDKTNPKVGRHIESDLIKISDLSNLVSAATQISSLKDRKGTLSQKGEPAHSMPQHRNVVQPLVLAGTNPVPSGDSAKPIQKSGIPTAHNRVVQLLVLTETRQIQNSADHGNIISPLIIDHSDTDIFGQNGDNSRTGKTQQSAGGPFRDVSLTPLGETILLSGMDVDVAINLRNISGIHGATNLRTHFDMKDHKAKLGPIKFNYGGGHFDVTGSMDLLEDPDKVHLSGSANGWDFAKVMHELGFKKQATGTVNATFNLSGRNSSAQDFLASMSGRSKISMTNGSIDSHLLDLAGLGVVPWLFSNNRKKITPIVCATAPFNISKGHISTKQTVIETDLVQVVVLGKVDMNSKSLDIIGQPRKIGKPLSRSPWPFTANGSFDNPKIKVKDGARRVRRSDGASTMPEQRKLCIPDILQLE